MNLFKKITSILLVCALTLPLASCSKASTRDYIEVDGKKVTMKTIGTINGEEVPFDLFAYTYLTYAGSLSAQTSETFWDENPDALNTLNADTLASVKGMYATEVLAKANNIELTEEDTKSIDEQFKAAETKAGDAKKFKETLAAQNLDENLYKKFLRNNVLQSKLFNELYKDKPNKDTIIPKLKEKYARVYHILIKADVDGSTVNKELATKVLERLKAGEDFLTLMAEVGEDPGMESTPEGYYFKMGDFNNPVFEEASFALKENETSEIVEAVHGYHIIKRFPLEDSYFEENFAKLAEESYVADFNELLDSEIEKLEFVPAKDFELISPKTLF